MKKISAFSVRLISLAFNYIILVLINNQSGTELYGQYSYSFAFIFIYSSLLKFGFDTIIMRFKDSSLANEGILPSFYFTTFLGALFSLIAFGVFSVSYQILLASHFFSFTGILAELIRRKNHVIAYILYSTGLFLVFQTLGFIIFGASAENIDTILLFSFLLNLIALIGYIRVVSPMKLFFTPKLPSRELISDGFNSFLMNSSNMLNHHATIFILSFLTSKEILGIFSIAKRIANGVALPCQILNAENAPKFIEKRSNTEQFNAYLKSQMNMFFFVGFLLPLCLIPMMPLVLEFVHIDNDNVQVYYLIMSAFLLSRAIDGFTGPTFNLIRIFGDLRKATIIQIFVYTLMLVSILASALITKWLALGVSIAVTTALIMTAFLSSINIIYTLLLRKNHGIDMTAFYFFRS